MYFDYVLRNIFICFRRPTESSERRFLFDVTGQDRQQPLTMQCLSEEDRKHWLEVMEGREPVSIVPLLLLFS